MATGRRGHEGKTDGKSWLQLVTEQSWEPELLISGLAIYSTLQLPGLLHEAYAYYRFNLQAGTGVLDETLPLIIFSLFTTVTYLLCIFFVTHFLIRAFWVGFIGLKSVYPEGIRYRKLPYSDYYVARAREKLGSADEMATKIDRIASLVFSVGFAIVLIFITTVILYVGFFLLYNISKLFLSPEVFDVWSKTVMTVFLLLLLTYVVVSIVLNTKRFRNNPRTARWHFLLTWKVSSVMMPLVYEPVNYISLTFLSNTSSWRFAAWSAGIFGVAFAILMGVTVSAIDDGILNPRSHYTTRSEAHTFDPAHYQSLREGDGLVVDPVIASPELDAGLHSLFLPYPKLMDVRLNAFCGEAAVADTLGRSERRRLLNRERLDCAERFFTFTVDDSVTLEENMLFTGHSETGQAGYRVSFYLPGLRPGSHQLQVRREPVTAEEKERRVEGLLLDFEWNIPFWTGE